MAHQRQHARLYKKRRAEKEYYFGYPLWKRALKRLERWNKKLWLRAFQLALGVRHVPGPLDPSTVRSVLFLRNDGIGDMVLTTPMFHAIKKYAPHIRIGVIGSFRNLSMLEHDTSVDRVFDCPQGDREAYRRVRHEIAEEKWDVILPMMYYGKTKMAILAKYLAPRAMASMLVKQDENAQDRGRLFSIVARSPYRTGEVPMIEQMRWHLLGTLRIPVTEEEWRPRLFPDPKAVERVAASARALLERDGTSRYIHVNLEAKSEFKEYGLEKSLALSKALLAAYPDRSIFWTSSPLVLDRLRSFIEEQKVDRVHVIATADVHELIAVVRGADLVVSPDTSIIHIASAEEKPVVGLYPIAHEWTPYKTPNRVVVPEDRQPVSSISVEAVLAACKEVLPA